MDANVPLAWLGIHICLEKLVGDKRELAIVAPEVVQQATAPERLAKIFTCTIDPRKWSTSDASQIFYGLGPEIKAADVFLDLTKSYGTVCLDNWSMVFSDGGNIRPMNPSEQIVRYSLSGNNFRDLLPITRSATLSTSSLLAYMAMDSVHIHKTGILQRVLASLVRSEFLEPATFGTRISQLNVIYRYIKRVQLEWSPKSYMDDQYWDVTVLVRQLCTALNIGFSTDETPFHCDKLSTTTAVVASDIDDTLAQLDATFPLLQLSQITSRLDRVGAFFRAWSGSTIVQEGEYFHIQMDAGVKVALEIIRSPPPFCAHPTLHQI